MDLTVGDDDLRLTAQDRLDEVADALLRVLVVSVGVDHDVRAELEGALHSVVEGAAQSAIAGVPDEMGHPVGLRHLDRSVGRAVVDDQHDDLGDAGNLLRDRGQDQSEGVLLVQARHLDDQPDSVVAPARQIRRRRRLYTRLSCVGCRPTRVGTDHRR